MPLGKAGWLALAARVQADFPLAGSDWVEHADAVESGFYSVHQCTKSDPPAKTPMHFFAEEPPLSPEEEEAAAASHYAVSAQMELF